MMYFVHGPDRLLAREAAMAISAELDPDGANTSWLDGRETSVQGVVAAIGAVSFFGGARVVVVTDLLGRAGRDSGQQDSEENGTGQAGKSSAILGELANAVPDHHCLILLEPSLIAAPAALRKLAPQTRVISGEPPRGNALTAWIATKAEQSGSTIEQRAAQHLAASLFPQTWDRKPNNPRYDRPPDMSLLAREIEKLALAAYPGVITVDHVSALVPSGPDQRVFRFLDAAMAGDVRTATSELERLQAAGDEPAMVLAQLLGQIELQVIASESEQRDANTISRDLGSVTPARMSAIMSSARRQGHKRRSDVEAGVAADRGLKTGRTRRPEDALHDLMLALAETGPQRKTGRSR